MMMKAMAGQGFNGANDNSLIAPFQNDRVLKSLVVDAAELQSNLCAGCAAVRCCAVRCGAVRCGAMRCGAVLCCAVLCCAVLCCAWAWASTGMQRAKGACWIGQGVHWGGQGVHRWQGVCRRQEVCRRQGVHWGGQGVHTVGGEGCVRTLSASRPTVVSDSYAKPSTRSSVADLRHG